jgi:allantoate deiminase
VDEKFTSGCAHLWIFLWIQVIFTVDIRSKDDTDREINVVRIEREIYKICKKRGVACSVERKVHLHVIVVLYMLPESSYLRDACFYLSWCMTLFCLSGNLQHEADAVACAPKLSDMLNSAAVAAMRELPPFRNNMSAVEDGGMMAPSLVSGAGHDAMAMSLLTQVWTPFS